ncbi:MAG: TIGR02266 family protein [Myxococcales bacterium]|nr:TIGR02266 family protein [Myxococcales bacterium]
MTPLHDIIARFKALDVKRSEIGLTPEEEAAYHAAKDRLEASATGAHDKPPSSRRQTLRVPSHLAVRFETAAVFQRAYLRNISEGGVYVATAHPFEMGHRFALTIFVDDGGDELLLEVEVVWVNRRPSPSSGLEPGVAVAWLDLHPEDKARIKAIVHRAVDDLAP